MLDKWDNRFLEMAKLVSTWSKDPSTKTGAVIVDQKRNVVGIGYNGFSRGVVDSDERYQNRALKYKMVVHAEPNAALCAGHKAGGGTLYTYPFMSCTPCAAIMIQAGIKRVVAPYSDNERWIEDFKISSQIFLESGVEVCLDGGPVGGYLGCY